MARQLYAVEKGLRLLKENADPALNNSADLLFGSGAPVGTSGETDAAEKGSIYLQTDISEICIYQKIADTSSASDWAKFQQEADTSKQEAGVTTSTELDSVLVDDVLASEWEVHMREDATPANVKVVKVFATHNGTAAADATVTDNSAFAKLKLGANFDAEVNVAISGAGAAQKMSLNVVSATAGVTFTSRRTDIKIP